ncbi:MAG: HEAT repeat domain-containing protein [Candidatus Methylacidiphilales bacterium]|nr:HEAT repeat domain-containing protein [Candidatus Methylacidiphilales bacterium]
MERAVLVITALLALALAGCGGKDGAAVKEVEKLITEKKYDDAMGVLQKALRDNPKSKVLLREQVNLFLKTEQVSYAIAAYRKLIENSPDDRILYQAFKNPDPVVRVTAAKALGLMKDARSVDLLIEHAKDKERSVRQAIVLALGDLKDKKALSVLVAALKDEDWFVRAEAALALGKVGDAQAAAKLFELLNDSDTYVKQNTRKALQELATEENKPAYVAALKNADPAIRSMAAIALATVGDSQGIDVLIEQLGRGDSKDTADLIRAGVKLRDPKIIPALRQAVGHPVPNIKALAILALGELGDQDSLGQIKAISTDKNQPGNVRTAAMLALNRLNLKAPR